MVDCEEAVMRVSVSKLGVANLFQEIAVGLWQIISAADCLLIVGLVLQKLGRHVATDIAID